MLGLRLAWSSRVRFGGTLVVSGLICLLCLSGGALVEVGDQRGGPYSTALLQQASLRSGLLTGLAILLVPLVALVGQAASVGSPARNHRLSALRLAGATRAGVRTAVSAEAAAPALLGSLGGAGLYAVLRRMLDSPLTVRGSWTTTKVVHESAFASTEHTIVHHGLVRVLPTDVSPGVVWTVATVVLVPSLSIAACWIATRAVQADPLRVVSGRPARRPPRVLPAVCLLLSQSALVAFSALRKVLGQPSHATRLDVLLVVILFAVTATCLMVGTASVGATLGRWIAESARSPSWLLAGRRLESDPYAASRSIGLVLLTLVVAVSGQAVKADFLVITDPEDPLYADALRLVDVGYVLALAMGCVGVLLQVVDATTLRREQFALQLAQGTPVAVLRRAVVLEVVVPLVPGVLAASAVGLLGVRGVLGTGHTEEVGRGPAAHLSVVPIPVPWFEVGLLCAAVVAVVAGLAALTFVALGRDLQITRE